MYSISDGGAYVALDNPTYGWALTADTKPLSELVLQRAALRVPGVHGVVAGVPATFDAPTVTFVVQTPRANADALVALFLNGTKFRVDGVARFMEYEYLSHTYQSKGVADSVVDVAFTLRLPSVLWRDSEATVTDSVTLTAASQTIALFPSSAPIADATVRVKGPVSGLVVRSGATWFSYPTAIPAGSYLRFVAATRGAWVTTSDTWSGGTNVSGLVTCDGPNRRFEVVPVMVNPLLRNGQVTVETATRGTGNGVQVRGRGAFYIG